METKPTNQIVSIDHNEYGLEENRAKQIASQFQPMLDKMKELEEEYNEVINLEINEDTCQKAKELRNKYVKVRTGTAKIHKEQKAFYRAGGLYVDGWKNAQIFASQGIEGKLKEIEDYYVNQEKERLQALKDERLKVLSQYGEEDVTEAILSLNDDAFNLYSDGLKTRFEQAKEAERKAEEERIELDRKTKVLNERKEIALPLRQWIEDDSWSDFDINTSKDTFDRMIEYATEQKNAYEVEQKKIREANERLAKEKAEAEAKAKKLEEERIAKEKAEAEAIAKAKADEEQRIQAELQKGDAEKFNDLLVDLEELKNKYKFKSKKNQKLYSDVGMLLDKVIAHITK